MLSIKSLRIRFNQWMYRISAERMLSSVPTLRASAGEGSEEIQVPEGLEWTTMNVDGVRCEWMTPPNAPKNAALLYYHGGGGVLGLYKLSRNMPGHISLRCNLRTFLPDYRLAPEHPYPAGLDDCVTAYRWLLAKGFPAKRIVMAGDSMGGDLVICTLLRLRDAGVPLPAAAVCVSPNTDPTCSGRSMRTNAWRDAVLSPKFARTMMSLYVGGHALDDPYLAPLKADLRSLPPMLIQAGAWEILLDDSKRFSERARAAGVDLKLEIWPNMWHDWHWSAPDLTEANLAIDRIAEYVHHHI